MMKRIHCLGNIVVDALSGPLARYPEPKTLSQVVTQTIRFSPGGGACNTSTALARMGLPVALFAKVSDDANGRFALGELTRAGVDISSVCVTSGENTPFTFVGIHPDGDRTFIHTPGTNLTLHRDNFAVEVLLDTDFLLYQDCWGLPQLDGTPGAQLLAAAQQRGVVTALDACWGFGPRRDSLEAMAPYCDYLLLSADDLIPIYPGLSTEAMSAHLLAVGTGTCILKMGKDGCLLAQGTRREHIPAYPSTVVDTTGAGDCWDAGFLAALAQEETLDTAVRIGHACAAFSIEAIGGATGVPNYTVVKARARA